MMKRKISFRRFSYYLLILAIVVSCVTNGIFAKFTTQDDGGDGARVAKFGIVLNAAGDWYSNTYYKYSQTDGVESESSNIQAPYSATDDTVSVRASLTVDGSGNEVYDNVVAPGTKSAEGIVIVMEGTAETDTQVLYDLKLEDIFLMLEGRTYGVMVPLKKGVIGAHNFEEFKDTLYIEENPDGENDTYVKVTGNFDDTAIYYQIEDETIRIKDDEGNIIGDDSYTPITYSINGIFKPETNGDKFIKAGYKTDDPTKARPPELSSYYFAESINNYFIISPLTAYPPGFNSTPEVLAAYSEVEPDEKEDCVYAHTSGKSVIYETGSTVYTVLTLRWEWPYEQPTVSNKDGIVVMNAEAAHTYDTILGHIAAGNNVVKSTDGGATYTTNIVKGTDYRLETKLAFDITVNQVD